MTETIRLATCNVLGLHAWKPVVRQDRPPYYAIRGTFYWQVGWKCKRCGRQKRLQYPELLFPS